MLLKTSQVYVYEKNSCLYCSLRLSVHGVTQFTNQSHEACFFFFHSTVCKWQQERRGRKSIRVSTAVMPINSEFLCEWTVESGPGLMDKQCPGAWFSWALKAKTQLHSIIAFPKVFLSSIWAECKVVKGSSTKKLPIRHYFHLINKSRRRGHSAFGDKVQINKQLFAHVNIIIILSNVQHRQNKNTVQFILLFCFILSSLC